MSESYRPASWPRKAGHAGLRAGLALCAGALLLSLLGCAVPQPRGGGTLDRLVEPVSGRAYYLYLPKEYVEADEAGRAARPWPLVMTFHGMKPFDVANSQAREWEQEADRYGYIVVAPVLRAFGIFGEFPLHTINEAFKSDELATLAILDHVLETTHADPNNVLSTSWSSGGYMAHYMLNRHPERFTCLAVRQSNFSAGVLDAAATARSLHHPVLILGTENDFKICKIESLEAIKWYEGHGYKNFAWIYINRLGHERTPDIAADFFARVTGMQPNRPPQVLVKRQAIDGNAAGMALLAGNLNGLSKPSAAQSPPPRAAAGRAAPASDRRPLLVASGAGQSDDSSTRQGQSAVGAVTPSEPQAAPLRIHVSSSVGFEPLLLVYSAECSPDWQRSADFRWTLNGESIGHGVNGQRTISQPDDYVLELVVQTRDGVKHRARHLIRVLKNAEASAARSPRQR